MKQYDVVVIGGGAAGLSAALVLARARRSVAVVDAREPRNAPAAHMHGFLSRDGLPPRELIGAGREEVEKYGGDLIDGRVLRLLRRSTGFAVELVEGAALAARHVLVATGLTDVLPEIPGVRERWGRDLLHCPYCHGFEVRDQPLGVLGGSAEAVQHAQIVRQWSPDVVLFSHADTLAEEHREQLDARGIGVVDGRVAHLVVEDDRLTAVQLEDGRVVPRAAVFVRPCFVPHTELLVELGCASDDDGWVRTDAVGRTSTPGLWLAGNAGNPRAQVITAAGEGSAAAIAINGELVDDDVLQALRDLRAINPKEQER